MHVLKGALSCGCCVGNRVGGEDRSGETIIGPLQQPTLDGEAQTRPVAVERLRRGQNVRF